MKNLKTIFIFLLLILLANCMANPEEISNYDILTQTPFGIQQPESDGKTGVAIVNESNELVVSPTVTPTINGVLITPILTPTISMGTLTISSNPLGAEFRIVETGVQGKTPYSINLAPGTYTVTLNLDGYQVWEETILVFQEETSEIQGYLMPNPMGIGQYTTLLELGGTEWTDMLFLVYATWDAQQQSFVYAINKGVNLEESKDWFWWQYDPLTQENQALTPPESLLPDESRKLLNLCLLNELEWDGPAKCSYLTSLFESKENGMIVYSPLLLEDFPYSEGELWIAQSDGSKAQKLADFSPAYVHWSSDGKWFVTGEAFAGLPGQVIHYLAATDGSVLENLQVITGIDNFYLNGLFPEFSPNGQELLYAGSAVAESREESDYKLYIFNTDNGGNRLVTDKFGLFQWADDGKGIYILDGAFYPFDSSSYGQMRETNLYYVDITQNPPQEYLIARSIPYYPTSDYGSWNWVYSSTHHVIAYIGFNGNNELGVLQLESLDGRE